MTPEKKRDEIKLRCQRCNKMWLYTGDKKPNKKYLTYVACPRCKTSVKLKEVEGPIPTKESGPNDKQQQNQHQGALDND